MTAKQLEKISVIPQDDEISSHVPALAQWTTPMSMLDRAITGGASIEVLEKLMGLQERHEVNQARKAFDNAMADAVFPIIKKNKAVDFTSAKGRTYYKHEDLAEVLRTVTPILGEHGLSHRFRVTSNVNEPITVTCIISHRDGYFEETTLCAGKDDTGGKNLIQQVGSTITYLQRMTLKAALGLAASDDDDGRASGDFPGDRQAETTYAPPPGSITQDQADQIRDLLDTREVSRAAFLQWAKQKRIEDIPADHYDSCIAAISKFKVKS
jgi:ERF superfamily